MTTAAVWYAVVHAPLVARSLGDSPHRQQVRATGRARSRAEFGRMLAAAGLAQGGWKSGDPAAATARWLATHGTTTTHAGDVAAAAADDPGTQVYVALLNSHDATPRPWPSNGALVKTVADLVAELQQHDQTALVAIHERHSAYARGIDCVDVHDLDDGERAVVIQGNYEEPSR